MEIKKVLITGDSVFLTRYHFLLDAMSSYIENLEIVSPNESLAIKTKAFFHKANQVIFSKEKIGGFHKSKEAFITKSQQVERKIRQLKYTPDLVFHFHSMWSPFWNNSVIPYTIFLDYTMSLTQRTWSPWAPFINQKETNSWIACERQAYEQAYHLFTMSNVVKNSLVKDYFIEPQKITVIGSSGNFKAPYEGEKTFGSKQILFNGSDFERKGGDLVLAAFKQVKQAIPEAKLIIVGKKLSIQEDGIDNPGHISSISDMRNLFLKTDLVVAPAYCEPFGLFLIEAMNYGVPCIVSNRGGMPEIVDNEVNGVVINQLRADILAEQIVRLLSNNSLLTSMSIEARAKIRAKLNWNHIAKKIFHSLSIQPVVQVH